MAKNISIGYSTVSEFVAKNIAIGLEYDQIYFVAEKISHCVMCRRNLWQKISQLVMSMTTYILWQKISKLVM